MSTRFDMLRLTSLAALLLCLFTGVFYAGEPAEGGMVMILPEEAQLKEQAEMAQELSQMRQQLDVLRLQAETTDRNAAPEQIRSRNKRACIRIGGEMYTDYISTWRRGNKNRHSWSIQQQNLRFHMQFTPDVEARIKLNLRGRDDDYNPAEGQFIEEAIVTWRNICGGPIGLLFGKGEVPYGQDRTLGIIQSYNHVDASISPEGPILLTGATYGQEPYAAASNPGAYRHPGEVDGVVMAGANLNWDDTFFFEIAAFQVHNENSFTNGDNPLTSYAGRVWWNTPMEGLVVEVSGLVERDRVRANRAAFGNNVTNTQYAVSVGADWDIAAYDLEVFAEYQRGWDWNYTAGYNTHTVSLGTIKHLGEHLQLGGMLEWLHIDDRGTGYDYKKAVAHGRYEFGNGISMTLEYGFEWLNDGDVHAHTLALRSGVAF